jgi:hypothetical protein
LNQARLSHLQTFLVSVNLSKGVHSVSTMFPLKMILLEHRTSFEKQWQKLLQMSKLGALFLAATAIGAAANMPPFLS